MRYVCSRRRNWYSAALATVMVILTLGGATAVKPAASAESAAVGKLPVGTFEQHLDGFSGVGASRVSLSRDGAGRKSTRALVMRTTRRAPATTASRHRFAGAHRAGSKYVVKAWVRTSKKRPVTLRVREVSSGDTVQRRSSRKQVASGTWTRLRVTVPTKVADSKLAIRVRSGAVRSTERVLVDDLKVVRKPSTGGSTGSEPFTSRLSNGCGLTNRGIPACGTLVGAAHGSNTDPTALEGQLGEHLGVRRTYYTSTGVASAVKTARADLAAGRLPWISFKLPYSWADMVAGKGDAWARDLAQRMAALDGPVWLAFHHEPEGDGDIQLWRRMQERLAPLIRSVAPNAAFTVVVTGWNQFYGDAKYSLAEIWPRGVKVDVAGFDIYQQYGVVKNGKTTTKWTDFGEYYRKIATWARSNDVAWGLGETGVTDVAAAARPAAIHDAVTLMENYGGVAYSYFDTTLNSIAPWSLSSTAKRDAFADALSGSPRLTGR